MDVPSHTSQRLLPFLAIATASESDLRLCQRPGTSIETISVSLNGRNNVIVN